MKKKIDPAIAGKKLSLNKKTISNLAAPGTNSNNFWEIGPTKRCFTYHRCNTF